MTKYWVEWEMSSSDARSEVVEADDTLDAIAKVKEMYPDTAWRTEWWVGYTTKSGKMIKGDLQKVVLRDAAGYDHNLDRIHPCEYQSCEEDSVRGSIFCAEHTPEGVSQAQIKAYIDDIHKSLAGAWGRGLIWPVWIGIWNKHFPTHPVAHRDGIETEVINAGREANRLLECLNMVNKLTRDGWVPTGLLADYCELTQERAIFLLNALRVGKQVDSITDGEGRNPKWRIEP